MLLLLELSILNANSDSLEAKALQQFCDKTKL
ncbi:MAG: hypothetical protein ACJAYG_001228, partial [Oceanicoccus sp.]